MRENMLFRNKYMSFLCQILILMPQVIGYNVDTEFPILYGKGPLDNYFGFSVGLLRSTHGYRALITAPRANSSFDHLKSLHQPGALFSCNISTGGGVPPCEEVEVDSEGNVRHENKYSYDMSYTNKRDDMWLGVSLDVQHVSRDNNVLVCGHLWKNEVKSSSTYYVQGACYVLNTDLNISTVNKIVPFVDTDRNSPGRTYYYEHSQTGASASFSEDGLSLLLGSPGYGMWAGSFVSYHLDGRISHQELDDPIIPIGTRELNLPFASYLGYSMTSGNFFADGTIYTAVGAPRDHYYRGRVYIFLPLNSNNPNLYLLLTIDGQQIGEYFGASISGIDMNGDGLTDLLVGAPFYSDESQEYGGDEGKVYVYLGTKEKGFVTNYNLYGGNKPNARFGTSIGNIGDLNQDGLNDVAVGAPYEDEKGAVYIYHGRINGIHRRHAQRIGAGEISPLISGFGISISRGLDIDGNFYSDILIGSYSSSNAVLLRTYPVIKLTPSLSFDIPKINMNILACDSGSIGGKLPCFNVTYCLKYSGTHVPTSLEFQSELRIDTGGRKRAANTRGFFLSGDQTRPQTSISRRTETFLSDPKRNCFQETAYIHRNILDEITPVQFLLRYRFDRNATVSCQSTDFPKDCPVVDPAFPTSITRSISFQIDCKSTCEADLSVEANIPGNSKERPLIIGQDNSLTIFVTVKNTGEPAYVAELFINLPRETPLLRYNQCEKDRNQQDEYFNTTLKCSFGNALKNGEAANVQIVIDPKNIPAGTSSLTLYFRATTVSEDTDMSNNEWTLPIYFETAADVNITGNPENREIPQTEDRETVSVTHNYYVKYYGPSAVDKIEIALYVPSSIKGENGTVTFLTLDEFVADSGEILTKCSVPFTNMGLKSDDENEQDGEDSVTPEVDLSANNTHHLTKRNAEEGATESSEKRGKDYTLDCESTTCDVIYCDASPFRSGQKSIKLTLTFQIDLDTLSSVMDAWNSIKFVTKGEISTGGVKMLSNSYRNETTVETTIIRMRPPGTKEVEQWIIFVSVGVGLLLLLIILVVLIKIGFFKRKQRERMKSMRHQVQMKEMQAMSAPDAKEVVDDKELCPKDSTRKMK